MKISFTSLLLHQFWILLNSSDPTEAGLQPPSPYWACTYADTWYMRSFMKKLQCVELILEECLILFSLIYSQEPSWNFCNKSSILRKVSWSWRVGWRWSLHDDRVHHTKKEQKWSGYNIAFNRFNLISLIKKYVDIFFKFRVCHLQAERWYDCSMWWKLF